MKGKLTYDYVGHKAYVTWYFLNGNKKYKWKYGMAYLHTRQVQHIPHSARDKQVESST